ncbi:MAG: SDR family oxidoreductase [Bacteroidota bacterium]
MTNTLFDLKDKVAIVTGGAGALGSAMVKGLAQAGSRVAILGRTAAKGLELADSLQRQGLNVTAVQADVLNQQALQQARAQMLSQWGSIDILVNCAGGNRRGATIMPEESLFDLNLNDFDQVTALNLKGSLLPTLVFGETMAAQKKGSIINISSMSAQRPLTRVLGYSAAKAAIDSLTKWLAVELAHKFGEGIRVNAIAPGFFVAEQNRHLLLRANGTLTQRGQQIIEHTPMGRFGEPEELCGPVIWLASEASRFVTGTVINVDGGFGAFSGI